MRPGTEPGEVLREVYMSQSRVIILAVGGLLLLAGCANQPTSAELTESILRAAEDDPAVAVSDVEAACIANQLFDANLSDTTMAGLAENFDEPEVLSAEINRVEPAVANAAALCLGQE